MQDHGLGPAQVTQSQGGMGRDVRAGRRGPGKYGARMVR